MDKSICRFTVHSFNYTVSIDLNLEAALCLYNLIRTPSPSATEPVLYALSEKIKHQFYRMKKLEMLGSKDGNFETSDSPVCGPVDTGSIGETELQDG